MINLSEPFEKSHLLRLLMRGPPYALHTPIRIAAPPRLSPFHRALTPPGNAEEDERLRN